MNLFDLFSNFCKLISQIEIDTKTQALYFNLLYLFNQNYFPKSLRISNDYLKKVLHITYKVLIVSRTTLINLQLITYTNGVGNKSGEYSLLDFEGQIQICMPYGNDKHDRVCPERTTNSTSVCPERTTNANPPNNPLYKELKTHIYKTQRESTCYIDTNNTHAHARDNETLSQKQLKFANAFPNKTIDCTIPEQIDIDLLIKKIQQSEFLSNCTNLTLKSYVKLYEQIVNDKYKDFKKKSKALDFEQRTYTQKDFDKLFDNLREVKI